MSETVMFTSNPYHAKDGERRGGIGGLPAAGRVCARRRRPGRPVPQRRDRRHRGPGPNVFKGYWRMPEKTEEFTADGWFKTGDVGKVDGDGYVTIVGAART